MNKNLEEKLKELRKGYINKLKDTLSDFKNLLEENPIDIKKIYSKIHTIAGTSGMYQINNLSSESTKFEFYLKSFKDNPDLINEAELKVKLLEYINYLKKIVSVGESHG